MQSQTGHRSSSGGSERKYKGVRRRNWGKWVSEIRVPGSRDRLWLGSYSNPEAAAVAHDTAVFFLRGPGRDGDYNFPDRLAGFVWASLTPLCVQKGATDIGMAVDAEMAIRGAEVAEGGEGWERGCNDYDWRGDIPVEGLDFYL